MAEREYSEEDEANANHEAGHVAARWWYGIPVDGATIEAKPRARTWANETDSPELTEWRRSGRSKGSRGVRLELEHQTVSMMAGEIAQYRAMGRRPGWPHKERAADGEMNWVHGCDVKTWQLLIADLGYFDVGPRDWYTFARRTRRLFHNREAWAVQQAIARALLEERTLDRTRIEEIARPAAPVRAARRPAAR